MHRHHLVLNFNQFMFKSVEHTPKHLAYLLSDDVVLALQLGKDRLILVGNNMKANLR